MGRRQLTCPMTHPDKLPTIKTFTMKKPSNKTRTKLRKNVGNN